MSNLKHESEYKEILAECWDKVLAFFNNNATKTFQWFSAPNQQLADKTPIWMLKTGRGRRLKQFIDSSLEENQPPELRGHYLYQHNMLKLTLATISEA